MNKKFDFIFIGHGIGYPRKNLECYIWFNDVIEEKDKEKILDGIPEPLNCFAHWNKNLLHFGSDDYIRPYIREEYNKEIKAILSSGDDDLIDRFYEEAFEKYGDPEDPTDKEWEAFYKHLEDWLINVNSNFPINFFTKYIYTDDYTYWNIWSLEQLETKIIPYFEKHIKSGKINDDEYSKMNSSLPWIFNIILEIYFEKYSIVAIPEDTKNKIIYLIENLSGKSEYIDEEIFSKMNLILKSLPKGKDTDILKNMSPESLLNFFAASRDNNDYLKELSDNNIIEYLKKLISKTDISKTLETIYKISKNIAFIGIRSDMNSFEIIENEHSDPMLGAQIAELALNSPDCPAKLFEFAGSIYSGKGIWDKALEVFEKAFKNDETNMNILTGVLYAALNAGRQDVIDKYLDYSLSNPQTLNDPYPLSNIIYALNRKETTETSNIAIKLVEAFWKNPEKKMIDTLYINMSDTYIVANKIDPVCDEIIEQAIIELEKDFGTHASVLLENIACYYAMKDDKKNTIEYLKQAKEKGHSNFASLKELKYFSNYLSDKDFNALFI